jgi:hypothetical protein
MDCSTRLPERFLVAAFGFWTMNWRGSFGERRRVMEPFRGWVSCWSGAFCCCCCCCCWAKDALGLDGSAAAESGAGCSSTCGWEGELGWEWDWEWECAAGSPPGGWSLLPVLLKLKEVNEKEGTRLWNFIVWLKLEVWVDGQQTTTLI